MNESRYLVVMSYNRFFLEYPKLRVILSKIQKNTRKSIRINNPSIENYLDSIEYDPASFVYPTLFTIFITDNNQKLSKNQIDLASSLQILFLSNLVHSKSEQLSDNATEEEVSTVVYCGDFLFTIYFNLLSNSTDDRYIVSTNAEYMKKILIGDLDKIELSYNYKISLKQYFRYILDSCAQLYSFSCYQGAYFSGMSKNIQQHARIFGKRLGMYCQLSKEVEEYKNINSIKRVKLVKQIKNGRYTLPLIIAINNDLEYFEKTFVKDNRININLIEELIDWVLKSQSIYQCENILELYNTHINSTLSVLKNVCNIDALTDFTKFLMINSK